jgi:hypothetical protein
MPELEKRSDWRDSAGDLWRNTLSHIPTLFGRIAYLASLRNPNSGRYEHHGLTALFGEEEADRALRESHARAFAEWLNRPLAAQRSEVEQYLEEAGQDAGTLLIAWYRLRPYRGWVPDNAGEADRRLFIADLEMLLELLRNEYGVVVPDPDA